MLDQYSSMRSPKQPKQNFNFQFATLRNELATNKIPFTSLVGFQDVKQLMLDRTNKNIIVINNLNMNPSEIPKEIFEHSDTEIYMYPNQVSVGRFLTKPQELSEIYNRYTGNVGSAISKSISLKSVKKDIQRSKEKKMKIIKEFYDKIMIMNERGHDPQYINLYNVLQGYKDKVIPINRQNDIKNYSFDKALLILEKQAYDSMNRFISGSRLDKVIDLAIFGYGKGLEKAKNFAITTDVPSQIIQYITESGTSLMGAKQKLQNIKKMSNNNNSEFNNTGIFLQNQPSFANNNNFQNSFNSSNMNPIMNINAKGNMNPAGYQYPNKPQYQESDNGEVVTYTNSADQNQIPLTSKLSEEQKGEATKKSIKKIKKVEPSSKGQQSGLGNYNSNEPQPEIIINAVHSVASSQDNIRLNNEINFEDSPKKPKKKIMNWYVFPDQKNKNNNGFPTFTLQSEKGQIFSKSTTKVNPPVNPAVFPISNITSSPNNMNTLQNNSMNNSPNMMSGANIGTIRSVSSIGSPSLQNGQVNKPVMNWYIKSDSSRQSRLTGTVPAYIQSKQNMAGPFPPLSPKSPSGRTPVSTPIAAPSATSHSTIMSAGTINNNFGSGSFNDVINNRGLGVEGASNNFILNNNQPSAPNKKIMNWYLKPDTNRKSSLFNGPFFVFTPDQNLANNNSSQKSINNQNISFNANNSTQNTNMQNSISNNIQKNIYTMQGGQTVSYTSKAELGAVPTVVAPSSPSMPLPQVSTLSLGGQAVNNITTNAKRIEDKYKPNKTINQVSQQYNRSNLSYPFEDSAQRNTYSTQRNSLGLVNQPEVIVINSITNINRSVSQEESPNVYNNSKPYYSQFNRYTLGDNNSNTNISGSNSNTLATNSNASSQPYSYNIAAANSSNSNTTTSMNRNLPQHFASRVVRNESSRSPQTTTIPIKSEQTISSNPTNKNQNSGTSIYRNQVQNSVTSNPSYSPINKIISANLTSQPAVQTITSAQTASYSYSPINKSYTNTNEDSRNTIDPQNRKDNPADKYSSVNAGTNNYTKPNYASDNTYSINTTGSLPYNYSNPYGNRAPPNSTPNNTVNNINLISNSPITPNNNGSSPVAESASMKASVNRIVLSPESTITKVIENAKAVSPINYKQYSISNNTSTYSNAFSPGYNSNPGYKDPNPPKPASPTLSTQSLPQPTATMATTTTKNNLQSIGLDENKYELITDQDGVRRYRIKDSYNLEQDQTIAKKYEQTRTQSLGKERKSLFNFDEYDEHTDQRGNKYYTIKKTTTPAVGTMAMGTTPAVTSTTVGKPTSPIGYTSPSQSMQKVWSSQNLMSQSKPTPNLLLQSRLNESQTSSRFTSIQSPTSNTPSPNTYTSTNGNSNNINPVYNPYAYSNTDASKREVNTNNTNTNTYTNSNGLIRYGSSGDISNTPNANGYRPAYEDEYRRRGSEALKMYSSSTTPYDADYANRPLNQSKATSVQISKSPDAKFKTVQKTQNIVQGNKVIDISKKYMTGPNMQARETRISQQSPSVTKEVYKFESYSKTTLPAVSSPVPSPSGLALGRGQQSHQSNSQSQSQFTDSKSSSLYKFTTNLYNDHKNFNKFQQNISINSQKEYEQFLRQYKTLKIHNNFIHYILDTAHPLRNQIYELPHDCDQIVEVDGFDRAAHYMEKTALPNENYDLGFIFLANKTTSGLKLTPGYYLVTVAPQGPTLSISQPEKTISLSSLEHLHLAKKLLLAPSVSHYIFYPRQNQSQISKLLNLFPSAKFTKYGYVNKNQLENLFGMYLKNKGRMTRSLVFVNCNNIEEIAPMLENHYNYKTFTMVCVDGDAKLKAKWKKVPFIDGFDFGSYGSIINMGNASDISYMDNNYSAKEESINPLYTNTGRFNRNQMESVSAGNPKIYIQHPHKKVEEEIKREHPNQYQIQFFTNISEIKDKNKDNFILLHREADNVGSNFDRNIGTVILLEGKKGDRVPSGAITIGTIQEFVKDIL